MKSQLLIIVLLGLLLGTVGSSEKTPQLAARYSDLLKRVEAIPGVQVASLVGHYGPMSLREWLALGYGPGFGPTMSVLGARWTTAGRGAAWPHACGDH